MIDSFFAFLVSSLLLPSSGDAGLPSIKTSASTNRVYQRYDLKLIYLYADDQIGYDTLYRLWLGTKPDQAVIDKAADMLAQHIFIQVSRHTRHAIQRPDAAAGSYSLSSATPGLPFFGNQTVVLSTALFDTGTNVTAVGLRRAGDCSLVESFMEPVDNVLTDSSIVELPNFQDYLHTLAGLSTTPDVYPSGCDEPTSGRASVNDVVVVGVTASGLRMVADLNPSTGYLEVKMIDSQGTQTTQTLGTSEATALQSVDVNGDSNDDLIVSGITDPSTGQKSFVVYLNNGDGTFQGATYFDAPADRFLLDDINGDGKIDIVGHAYTGGVVTLLGHGDGTFGPAASSATSVSAVGNAMVSGDFDGDGKADLLLGNIVLKGSGTGSYVAGPVLPAAAANDLGFSYYATVGDLNGDGKLDIVYTSSTGNYAQVLLGHGDGTFSIGARYASLPAGQRIALTDIDGDGNLDMVVGSSSKGVFFKDQNDPLGPMQQILLGRGDGTFASAPMYDTGTAVGNATGINVQPLSTGGGADFNGDGKLDVLTYGTDASASNTVTVLPGDGTGVLGTGITSAVRLLPTAIASADFDGDGKLDVVAVGSATSIGQTLALLKGQGDGHFAAEQDYPLTNVPNGLAIGDFNGDGHPDIAVGVQPALGGGGDSGVYVFFGKADGTLAAPVKIDASVAPVSLVAADLNGDGRADLIVADEGNFAPGHASLQINGAIHVYSGNADGSFTALAAPVTSATNYTAVRLGDLNGDGKLDLVVGGIVVGTALGSGTPYIYTLLGNGDGTFKAAVTAPSGGTDGIGANSMTLADFNGDGHLDVAVGNSQDYTEIFLGAGDGTLARTALALGQQPAGVAALDLNGDGMPDLLLSLQGGVAVFMNSPKAQWTTTTAPTTAATAITLTATPTHATVGQAVTLTAAVTSSTAGSPSGTVTFFDGTTSLGTGTLAQGSASLTTSSLVTGAHSLTAQYGGDSTYATSTSSAVALTITGNADFAISANPTSGTVSAGQSATAALTLTPSDGFDGTVALTCAGAPSGAACTLSPGSLSVNGAAATTTLTITTTARTAQVAAFRTPAPGLPEEPLLAILVGPRLLRHRSRRATRVGRLSAGLASVIACATLLAACHHDEHAVPPASGTPAGVYTVTVTATGNSLTHTVSYNLTVN